MPGTAQSPEHQSLRALALTIDWSLLRGMSNRLIYKTTRPGMELMYWLLERTNVMIQRLKWCAVFEDKNKLVVYLCFDFLEVFNEGVFDT